jgi:hypothetical protein
MRNRLLLLPALSAALLVGCSVGTTTIDSDKAEKEITKGFEQQVPGSEVKSLSCPDDVEAKKGETAECDITLADGKKGTINVRVLNEDGDIRWNVGSLK